MQHSTQRGNGARGGFTLVELLVVIFLMMVLGGLAVPAFNLIARSGSLTGTASDLAHLLEQARSYAMGKNTYVYVGLVEVDADGRELSPSRPVAEGIGCLVVGIVSSRDGSRGYDPNAGGDPMWADYGGGADFSAVSRLRVFPHVHMADLGPASSAGMDRPATDADYNLGSPACRSATPVAWPPGRSLNAGQYNFTKVIQFDPQGSARIILAGNGGAIPKWIEIGLQPANGREIASSATGNQAALQINGVSGAVRVYRP